MGDRANVVIIDSQHRRDVGPLQGIYLYSRWGGYRLPVTLAEALDTSAARNRWDNGAYLTRIIFEHMISGDPGGETGFGIALFPPDNDLHPMLVVDVRTQEVRVMGSGTELSPTAAPRWKGSLEAFIAAIKSAPHLDGYADDGAWVAIGGDG